MPGPSTGRTVAITEHRFENEFRTLVERHGATVISCPLLEERPVGNHPELGRFLDHLIAGDLDTMVFFTGVGVRFMAAAAGSRGRLDAFVAALDRLRVAARGPKPRAALRELGRGVDLAPDPPTSAGLLDMFRGVGVRGERIGVQLYGRPNPDFIAGLEAEGAIVTTVHVYDYAPASDRERVLGFIRTLLDADVDVVTFTSAPQVGSLFEAAESAGFSDALAARLNGPIAVAVIGEVAESALARRGIHARIRPRAPKMAALAQAIGDHLAGRFE